MRYQRCVLRFLFRPHIPLPIFGLGIATGFLKPRMLVGCVIHDQVDEHPHAALLAPPGKLNEIAKSAIARIDAVVVRHIVAVILARRWLKRHQPKCRDTHPLKIVQATHQPFEIADPIAVGIHISADGKAVDYGVLVPKIIDHLRVLSPPVTTFHVED